MQLLHNALQRALRRFASARCMCRQMQRSECSEAATWRLLLPSCLVNSVTFMTLLASLQLQKHTEA